MKKILEIMSKEYLKVAIGSFFFGILLLIDNIHSIGFLGDWKYGTLDLLTGTVSACILLYAFGRKKLWKYKWIVFPGLILTLLSLGAWVLCFFKGYPYTHQCLIMMNVWSIGTAIACLLPGWLKKKQKPKADMLILSFMIFYFLAVLSRNTVDIPFIYLMVFLLFYLSEEVSEKRNVLVRCLENGAIAGFWIVQIFAWGFRPYDNPRYDGFYYNVQSYACVCLIVFVLSFMKCVRLLYAEKKMMFRNVVLWINFLAVASFLLLTISRTTMIIAAVVVISITIWILIDKKPDFVKVLQFLIKKILLACCVFAIVFLSVRFLPTILSYPVWFGNEYFEKNVILRGESWDSEKYVEFDEYSQEVLGRLYRLVIPNTEKAQSESMSSSLLSQQEVGAGESELTENTTIVTNENNEKYYLGKEYNAVELRVAIWRTYLSKLNLFGHQNDELNMQINEDRKVLHPHNIFVNMFYSYGIPAGIFFVIWCLIFFKRAVQYAANREQTFRFTPLAVFMAVLGYGIADAAWQAGTMMWFSFLFVQILLLRKAYIEE